MFNLISDNQPLSPGDIQESVTHLEFGWEFNQPLSPGDIPNSVTHLRFGVRFNQPLSPGVIPNSVTHLEFGWHFNQPIYLGVIPSSVNYLEFGKYFNQPLSHSVIPSSVICMVHSGIYNPNEIPKSIITFNNKPYRPPMSYPVVQKHTNVECLIYKSTPEKGSNYLSCSLKPYEHIMDYDFMCNFNKTTDLKNISCVYCSNKVNEEIYEQV